jgi:hypothetical protein
MLGKTLIEMTNRERSNLIKTVATTLEVVASRAEERGDEITARNALCLAMTVMGCAVEAGRDLEPAELLLEQAITVIAQNSDLGLEKSGRRGLH